MLVIKMHLTKFTSFSLIISFLPCINFYKIFIIEIAIINSKRSVAIFISDFKQRFNYYPKSIRIKKTKKFSPWIKKFYDAN